MMTMKRTLAVSSALALFLTSPNSCNATEFLVDTLEDSVDAEPGNGLCADAIGACSIRAALIEANTSPDADRIVVPAGSFAFSRSGQNEDAATSGDLDILGPVHILGSGSQSTILDAASIDRVFDLHSAAAGEIRLEGLELRNGRMDAQTSPGAFYGIAVNVRPLVQVRLDDVVMRGHRLSDARQVSGIANSNGCVVGHRIRILENRVSSSPLGLIGFSGGIATTGADSCMDIEDLEISGNDSAWVGAIYLSGGAPMTIRRGLIAGNRGNNRGAMLVDGSNTVFLENVTISGNQGHGGAVLNDGHSTLRMINCTVAGNTGMNDGTPAPFVSGLQDVHGRPSKILLTNTLIADNGTRDCNEITSVDGGNLIGNSNGCFVSLPQASDRFDIDAQLQALADVGGFSQAHVPGIEAIDRGVGTNCPLSDQRSASRPQDGDGNGQSVCDIGAIESLPAPVFRHGFEN